MRLIRRERLAGDLRTSAPGPGYRWIALSNTTLGTLMATINGSIILIALPDIFRGIGVNPLLAGNASLLLWVILGYLLVTAVLVVIFGRLGDMFGRVRIYTLGFAVFTVFSILLGVTWLHGTAGALWLIAMRILQAVGGAMLFANAAAILTDAFPADHRGMALGLNQVAGITGQFVGLILGGLLGPVEWHLVFLVSVPFGVFGTFWAYRKLRELGERRPVHLDWWGNLTFGAGLTALLAGITYGIQPYGGHTMGWTNPWVITGIAGGIGMLGAFCALEVRAAHPMFNMSLFRIRAFSAGNLASMLAALGRGGLMFILIIWLQGIYLPQHGYSFSQTPLWAGIAMLPLTIGFLAAGPVSGALSDRRPRVHHWRHDHHRGVVPAAGPAAGQLRLLAVRADPAAGRRGPRTVQRPEPGRDHEQPAAGQARRRIRDDRHLPELRHGAVDRDLLHPDHPRAGSQAAARAQPWADRPGRAARQRRQAHRPAPGVGPVRRAARL